MRNMTLDQARAALEAVGLKLGTVTTENVPKLRTQLLELLK